MLKKVEGATKYGGTDLSGEGSLFPKAKKDLIHYNSGQSP